MDAMTAQARRFYHHVHHGGSLKESDVAAMVRWMEGKDATIARLTAERDEARATAAAAYERAAQYLTQQAAEKGGTKTPQGRTAQYYARKIRALATEAETTALAEIVKKAVDEERKQFDGYILHKRNCDMMSAFIQGKHCTCGLDAILARLDQPKEESV